MLIRHFQYFPLLAIFSQLLWQIKKPHFPTAPPHPDLYSLLTTRVHLMFPDDADPIIFLKDSYRASYQRWRLFFLQKEQFSFLFQLNHILMGAQLPLITPDCEEFVFTGLENWAHLIQIVSFMYIRTHTLSQWLSRNSGKSSLGRLDQKCWHTGKSNSLNSWNTFFHWGTNMHPLKFILQNVIRTTIMSLFMHRFKVCTSQFSFPHKVCLRRNWDQGKSGSESFSLTMRTMGHDPQTWVSFGQYVFPKDEVTFEPES